MKKNLQLIFGFFSLAIITLLVLFILYTSQFETLLQTVADVSKTNAVSAEIQKIQSSLIELENIETSFLLTKRDTAQTFSEIDIKAANLYTYVANLAYLTRDNKTQQQTIIKIKDDIWRRLFALKKALNESSNNNGSIVDIYNTEESALMHDFNRLLVKMESEELKKLQILNASKKNSETLAPSYVQLIMVFSIIVVVIAFGLMVSEFRRRKIYEKELELKLIELNANKSELEELTFVASHHLKEPIRKIRTFNNLMAAQADKDDSAKGYFNKIDSLALRMQQLIDDLVQYIAITKKNDNPVAVDLNESLENAVNILQEQIRDSNAVISITAKLPSVTGHPEQVDYLFTHLLENAIKYRKEDSPLRIIITCSKIVNKPLIKRKENQVLNDFIKVTISDNGIGFDNEFAEKIFSIFQKLHGQNSAFVGKGIGLSICRKIMVNHFGDIEANGEKGIGASFHLYFPV